MTHQKIETPDFKISYCDCQKPIIQIIDKKRKVIIPMSVDYFLLKIKGAE